MILNYNKTSLFSALLVFLNSAIAYAQTSQVPLKLSVANTPEGKSTTVIFHIPEGVDVKSTVKGRESDIREYDHFPWKSLKDIKLNASTEGIPDIKEGNCINSVPSFVNDQGKLIDSLNLALSFDVITHQVLCDMSGTYKKDGTVRLYAKLSKDTNPRIVSFTINNHLEDFSLTSDTRTIKNGYPMPSLLNHLTISTNQVTVICPPVAQFTNGTKILTAVTYEISYSPPKLSCTPLLSWQEIL